MLFLQLLSWTTAVVLWCLNESMWQRAGVTVINPFPLQACHLHNKATIPDAKANPHAYCYNYLTFKSTLMRPGWSHSLSSFGFQALLLSNKVTFHNIAFPWNTQPPHKYTSTCICSTLNRKKGAWKLQENKAVGGLCKAWICISSEVDTKRKSMPPKLQKTTLLTTEVLLKNSFKHWRQSLLTWTRENTARALKAQCSGAAERAGFIRWSCFNPFPLFQSQLHCGCQQKHISSLWKTTNIISFIYIYLLY